MCDYNELYEFIDSILPKDYNITWGDMDELSENSCGIYLRSGSSSFKRDLSNNVYVDSCSLVLNIHSNKSSTGVLDGNDYACRARRALVNVVNQINEKGTIHILKIDPLGNVNHLGKNIQGIPVYSINFKILYNYKEVM